MFGLHRMSYDCMYYDYAHFHVVERLFIQQLGELRFFVIQTNKHRLSAKNVINAQFPILLKLWQYSQEIMKKTTAHHIQFHLNLDGIFDLFSE